jgi:hypothetical protein
MAEMSTAAGSHYEGRLLKEFIGMMGIFPSGTVVQLDTGEIGLVDKSNRDDPLRPTVKIVRGRGGGALKEPVTVDLGDKVKSTGKYERTIIGSIEDRKTDVNKLDYL